MPRPTFNYIITIHNKEALLDRVLSGVAECAGPNARILPVLDGCTDRSEDIARRFAQSSSVETHIATAPDVHEIRSINAGLRAARPGYCVILQDDVILQDPDLEEKVDMLCEAHRRKIGYISFRLAADVRGTSLLRRVALIRYWGRSALIPLVEEFNHIAHPREQLPVPKAPYGEFQPRMVGIKSPVCLTPELRVCEPYLDEDFAPYCYDDVDMSLRSLRRGLVNGLFPIKFQSDLEWGGTRKDPSFSSNKGKSIFIRNRRLVWRKHAQSIRHANATTASVPRGPEPQW